MHFCPDLTDQVYSADARLRVKNLEPPLDTLALHQRETKPDVYQAAAKW